MEKLIEKMLTGDRVALARLMSYIENRFDQVSAILAKIHQFLGRAEIIGITGPPGAGKSTLVDQMIGHYRALGKKVGVVAVDPSSPFTGGALLGDRVRMVDHAEDENVFIRSLGSRGALGGLSRATRNVVRLMDAFGYDIVIVETVGVGQTEMDVLEVAHTTVVVLTPESGDTMQTLKAGLLEAADVFAVNKSDRDGAHKIHQELLKLQNELSAMDSAVKQIKKMAETGETIATTAKTLQDNYKEHLQNLEKLIDERIKEQTKKLETVSSKFNGQIESLKTEALAKFDEPINKVNLLNTSIASQIETIYKLTEKLDNVDFPIRLDKIDANIAGIMAAIQSTQSRLDNVERNLSDKMRDFSDRQKEEMQSMKSFIDASAKKQQTNSYITWALVAIGIVTIILLCKN